MELHEKPDTGALLGWTESEQSWDTHACKDGHTPLTPKALWRPVALPAEKAKTVEKVKRMWARPSRRGRGPDEEALTPAEEGCPGPVSNPPPRPPTRQWSSPTSPSPLPPSSSRSSPKKIVNAACSLNETSPCTARCRHAADLVAAVAAALATIITGFAARLVLALAHVFSGSCR